MRTGSFCSGPLLPVGMTYDPGTARDLSPGVQPSTTAGVAEDLRDCPRIKTRA